MIAATESILNAYDESLQYRREFTVRLEELIRQLTRATGINVHSINSRLKDRQSLRDKIISPIRKYESISDITDISGIRIITYLIDDVNRIAELIEREFSIDKGNSFNKLELLEPDQFGYLSMHHIVSLSDTRSRLPEYFNFNGFKAEIQTRSILQHAWAEIEHDLGYKSRSEIPSSLKRRFFRLAGLLEIADQEFQNLNREIETYQESVDIKITQEHDDLELNLNTLIAYLNSSQVSISLDRAIASKLGVKFTDDIYYLEDLTFKILISLGLKNTRNMAEMVAKHSHLAVPLAIKWLEQNNDSIYRGTALFHCALIAMNELPMARRLEVSEMSGFITNKKGLEYISKEIETVRLQKEKPVERQE